MRRKQKNCHKKATNKTNKTNKTINKQNKTKKTNKQSKTRIEKITYRPPLLTLVNAGDENSAVCTCKNAWYAKNG